MADRTEADVQDEPRPLGWLFAKNHKPCPTCGHLHDCRPKESA